MASFLARAAARPHEAGSLGAAGRAVRFQRMRQPLLLDEAVGRAVPQRVEAGAIVQPAVVERAAAPLLGAPAYGVFCTAYVQDASGAPAEVWLGRRSKSKPTWPGLLDSVAAGR